MLRLTEHNFVWVILFVNVILSTTADTVATLAWEKRSWQHFCVVIAISPLVFLSFGYIGCQFGLSIAASLTNSLVVIGPVIIGLIFREEWKAMPWQIYLGIAFVMFGITIIMLYKPK